MATALSRYLEVCRLLNEAGARYLVIGQCAAMLYGHVRDTKDIDILVPRDLDNSRKVLEALSHLPLGLAREHRPEEIVAKVITIFGDMPRVDVLTGTGGYNYERALEDHQVFDVQGLPVPAVSLATLLAMKRNSSRLQDQADAEALERLQQMEGGHDQPQAR